MYFSQLIRLERTMIPVLLPHKILNTMEKIILIITIWLPIFLKLLFFSINERVTKSVSNVGHIMCAVLDR